MKCLFSNSLITRQFCELETIYVSPYVSTGYENENLKKKISNHGAQIVEGRK